MNVLSRAKPDPQAFVALETTLLVHGVPRDESRALARDLEEAVAATRTRSAIVGVVRGIPTVGLTSAELGDLLRAEEVPKANTANLGALIHRGSHAATTVSATMELAAAAGVRVFATGGTGGVHRGLSARLDISADLAAFTRFPVAVVCSGVKSLLDVESTREALEAIGVPVIGYGTDTFPAFYRRSSESGVDARFDDVRELARFVSAELRRTGRGVLVANPIPEEDEISERDWNAWLEVAQQAAPGGGRDVTPRLLARLHEVSGGATLRANLALVRANAALAGNLCREMLSLDSDAPHRGD